jgi:2-C-methyl-D-erythritol 4-phosphate cytidylyltransferase
MNPGGACGAAVKKQFLALAGEPVLLWTLRALAGVRVISEIVLVTAEEDIPYCERELVPRARGGGPRSVPIKVVGGGGTRQASVGCGLRALGPACGIVVIHDGVRPFVEAEAVGASIEAAARVGAACLAVRVTDTIKVAREGLVECTPDRTELWAAQTPQTFRRELLTEALAAAERDGFFGTDDVSLAERLGKRVALVEGSYENIKITTPKDLAIAAEIIKRRKTDITEAT